MLRNSGGGSAVRKDRQQQQQYRCSLINLDTSQDEELDAILGELTVLESQFDQEITADRRRSLEAAAAAKERQKINGSGVRDEDSGGGEDPASPGAESDRSSSNMTDLGIHSNSHSRSSSGSDQIKPGTHHAAAAAAAVGGIGGQARNGRMESPDTDSAFCDNLSVLSSCSSSNQTGQSGSTAGIPSTLLNLTKEEQEARIKAEKIKIAIEKIKEASVKKLFIKVFTSDGSAKSLLVDEKMSVGQVTRILAEKNHVALDPKWALVELVPDLYMERVYEDHEQLVENCLLWKVDSKNTLWFIERPEKFDLFSRPEVYLLGSSSSQKDDQMEDHSRYRIALKLRQIIFQMSGDFLIYSYIKCVIYNVYSVKYSRRQVKKVLK
jgi:amyloid beta A4 precursor protein-binding family B protein 1-interacting protein